jgi:hypothetical protein
MLNLERHSGNLMDVEKKRRKALAWRSAEAGEVSSAARASTLAAEQGTGSKTLGAPHPSSRHSILTDPTRITLTMDPLKSVLSHAADAAVSAAASAGR